jgi:phage terminase large subunit
MIEGLAPEVVMGRIYTGWKEIDELPHEARLIGYGLDFGFDPDPACIVAVYAYNGGVILDEKLYATRLLNEHLATTLKGLPQAPIVADSAESKSIAELQSNQLNVIPCEKGKDSVIFGIKHVQGLKVSYTKRSVNVKREYENYAWKRNKDQIEEENHLGIEDPACDNHALSAFRYFATMFCKPTHDEDYWDEMLREEYPSMKKEVNIAR